MKTFKLIYTEENKIQRIQKFYILSIYIANLYYLLPIHYEVIIYLLKIL